MSSRSGVSALFRPTNLLISFLDIFHCAQDGLAWNTSEGRSHGKRADEAQVQLMNNLTISMQETQKNEFAKESNELAPLPVT